MEINLAHRLQNLRARALGGEAFIVEMGAKGDWTGYQLNLNYTFQDWFKALLLAWRMGDAQASTFCGECLAYSIRAERASRNEVPHYQVQFGSFPYDQANLLMILHGVGGKVERLYPMYFKEVAPFSERHMNMLLVQRLAGLPMSASWSKSLARLAKNKRAKLSVETYETYDKIVSHAEAGDMQAALQHASHAAELFVKRANDVYFEGGPASEGGGPANDFVTDYVLAAIQRRLFAGPAPGAEIHWWRW